MQKSFVERGRHVSVIFRANSPLHSHQYAHFLLEDIKKKVFISSRHILSFKMTNLGHRLLNQSDWVHVLRQQSVK